MMSPHLDHRVFENSLRETNIDFLMSPKYRRLIVRLAHEAERMPFRHPGIRLR